MTRLPSHVLLVGFMGSGKSSVGRELASLLGAPFVDLDERIAASAGRSIPEIFAQDGEPAFRDLETAELAALRAEAPAIVACGGGVVVRAENRQLLAALGTVVFLEVAAAEAIRRCGVSSGRPMLAGRTEDEVGALLAEREPYYRAVADIAVATGRRTPHDIAIEIEARLGEQGLGGTKPKESE